MNAWTLEITNGIEWFFYDVVVDDDHHRGDELI